MTHHIHILTLPLPPSPLYPECLEGAFYSYAAYGHPIPLRSRGPTPIGGRKADLSPKAQALAEDIASDEIAHVKLLRAALGTKAFSCPLIDIGPAFEAVARGALNLTTLPTPFSPYGGDILFYLGAFLFEDVGVTAYHGALPLLSPNLLPTAAGILGTEAYHAGAIRTLLTLEMDSHLFPYGETVDSLVSAASAFRALLGEGKDGGIHQLVPSNEDAVVYSRTSQEVLSIVFGGHGKTRGVFFPHGVKGVIKSS